MPNKELQECEYCHEHVNDIVTHRNNNPECRKAHGLKLLGQVDTILKRFNDKYPMEEVPDE